MVEKLDAWMKQCRMDEKQHGFMTERIDEKRVEVKLEEWMRTNINESIKRVFKKNVDHKLKVK